MSIFTTTEINKNTCAFVKSTAIQVFPCGRRRSVENVNNTTKDSFCIPFDPEARLNTEANSRKYAGANGFSQTFIESDSEDNVLSFYIKGYSFKIFVEKSIAEDIVQIAEKLGENVDKICANIKIADTPLYVGLDTKKYNTQVLRNMTDSATPSAFLDIFVTEKDAPTDSDIRNEANYYFSGLTLTANSLVGDLKKDGNEFCAEAVTSSDGKDKVVTVSLLLLTKNSNGEWTLCERAKLPKISHGDKEDSVKLKYLEADSITRNGNSVPSITVNKGKDGYYTLSLLGADVYEY